MLVINALINNYEKMHKVMRLYRSWRAEKKNIWVLKAEEIMSHFTSIHEFLHKFYKVVHDINSLTVNKHIHTELIIVCESGLCTRIKNYWLSDVKQNGNDSQLLLSQSMCLINAEKQAKCHRGSVRMWIHF